MSALRIFVLLFALTLLGSGCTYYYKVPKVRKNFQRTDLAVRNVLRVMKQGLIQHKDSFTIWKKSGLNLKEPRFKELMKQHQRTKAHYFEVSSEYKTLKGLRKSFEKTAGRRRKITDKEPKYDQISGHLDEVRALIERVDKSKDSFVTEHNGFTKLVKHYRLPLAPHKGRR